MANWGARSLKEILIIADNCRDLRIYFTRRKIQNNCSVFYVAGDKRCVNQTDSDFCKERHC